MAESLVELFKGIDAPSVATDDNRIRYSVREVRDVGNYYVGMNERRHAALLISASIGRRRQAAPIGLARLDVQCDLPCHIERPGASVEERRFTVIRCLDSDAKAVEYFFSVCGTIIQILGETPTQAQIRSTVHRLVAIFQKTHIPSRTAVSGLFGELYVVSRSVDPRRLMAAWRIDPAARFDFVDGDARLEVKTTSRRSRSHIFSYEQCNPPVGAVGLVASIQTEQVSRGLTIKAVVEEIEKQVAGRIDLLLKLHEVVAATLGAGVGKAMGMAFDEALVMASLRYYDLRTIPAIRAPLPVGVSGVLFRVDLESVEEVALGSVANERPFWRNLPPPGDD